MWILIYTLLMADGTAVTKYQFKNMFKTEKSCIAYAEEEIIKPYGKNAKYECKLDHTKYWSK